MHGRLTIAVWLPLILSCAASPDAAKMETSAAESGHWVLSRDLQQIMAGLERNRAAVWPQEIQEEQQELTEPDPQKFEKAAAMAASLAEATGDIPSAVANVDMDEVDRRSFLAQVETLRDQAHRLNNAAQIRDAELMRSTLTDIDATCQSCHRRFRDFAGPL